MSNGIEYTKEMDGKILAFMRKNLLTIDGFTIKAKISRASIFQFRRRQRIGVGTLKKIKEHA